MARSEKQKSIGMKRTVSVAAKSRSNGSSTSARARSRYVVCLDNRGYDASLDVRKLYRVIADRKAERLGLLRVVDESGGDYLYPKKLFAPVDMAPSLRRRLARV